MQLLVAAQTLSARSSLSEAVDKLVFTADTVTPNEVPVCVCMFYIFAVFWFNACSNPF